MMLTILVSGSELWNEKTETFLPETKDTTLTLEHSLVSLAKWECKWNKSFLSSKNRSRAEMIDYIRCMTLTQNVDPETYFRISNKNLNEVHAYIDLPMTAATFFDRSKDPVRKPNKIITAETIYFWMINNNIPFECQKWHLNRLLALIRFCNIENNPNKKKMPANEILRSNAALNAARRKAWNTTG